MKIYIKQIFLLPKILISLQAISHTLILTWILHLRNKNGISRGYIRKCKCSVSEVISYPTHRKHTRKIPHFIPLCKVRLVHLPLCSFEIQLEYKCKKWHSSFHSPVENFGWLLTKKMHRISSLSAFYGSAKEHFSQSS